MKGSLECNVSKPPMVDWDVTFWYGVRDTEKEHHWDADIEGFAERALDSMGGEAADFFSSLERRGRSSVRLEGCATASCEEDAFESAWDTIAEDILKFEGFALEMPQCESDIVEIFGIEVVRLIS